MEEPAPIQIPAWIAIVLRAFAIVVSVVAMLYAVLLFMETSSIIFGRWKIPVHPVPPLAFHIGSHIIAGVGFFLAGGLAISGTKKRNLKMVLLAMALGTIIAGGIAVLEAKSLWTLRSA